MENFGVTFPIENPESFFMEDFKLPELKGKNIKEHFENIRSIIEAIQPETQLDEAQFSAALTKTHHTLHGAMAKTASALNMSYRLHPIAGEVAPPNSLDQSTRLLMVLPLEVDDRFGQGFVQDRIRRSPHPVLVVSGHVPKTN